jgi:SAM-dependent methyltransferase
VVGLEHGAGTVALRKMLASGPMADPRVPARLQWAVRLLEVAPDDQVLEIGSGPGVSVPLICGQLTSGRITVLDRSATAIQRTTRRNADHVASGKAVLHQLDLADVDLVRRVLGGQRFDKVLAVNVNLFWVRPADAELRLIKDLLRPGGVVYLVYETPGKEHTSRVVTAVTDALASSGFATAVTTASSPSLCCVTGTRPTAT